MAQLQGPWGEQPRLPDQRKVRDAPEGQEGQGHVAGAR